MDRHDEELCYAPKRSYGSHSELSELLMSRLTGKVRDEVRVQLRNYLMQPENLQPSFMFLDATFWLFTFYGALWEIIIQLSD